MTYSHLKIVTTGAFHSKSINIEKTSLACLDMDRVGHIKNGNRSRSQSSREVRNKTQCNTIEMAALILGNNLQSDRFILSIL